MIMCLINQSNLIWLNKQRLQAPVQQTGLTGHVRVTSCLCGASFCSISHHSSVLSDVSLMTRSNRARLQEEIGRNAEVTLELHEPAVPPDVGADSGGVWDGAAAASGPGSNTVCDLNTGTPQKKTAGSVCGGRLRRSVRFALREKRCFRKQTARRLKRWKMSSLLCLR